MATSPNLGLTHIEQAQSQKEVTANEAVDGLDYAMNDTVDVACGAGGTITVALADFTANHRLRLTGSPAAAFTLNLPGTKRAFSVSNQSGKAATVQTGVSGGNMTVIVGPGERASLYSNGVDVTLEGSSAIAVPFLASGTPTDLDISAQIVSPVPFTIPADGILSQAKARAGAGSWEEARTFSLTKNGVEYGTVSFATAASTGTFTIASAVVVAAGDLLAMVNPVFGSPTTELRDVSVTVWGAQ